MGTNYPGGLDSLTNPGGGDGLSSPSHAAQHANANDAIEAIQAELGTSPRGSAATVRARLDGIENGSRITLPDASITPAKLSRPIGNLLTDNQASGGDALGNTNGFSGWNCALGYASGRIVGTKNTGDASCAISLWPRPAVTAGDTISVYARIERLTAPLSSVTVFFVDSGGSLVGSGFSVLAEASDTGIRTATVTVTVPDGAVAAFVDTYGIGGGIGTTHAVHRLGVWKGAGGLWQMPGVPIPHTGIRTNPANTSQVQVWNDATATWITV